MFLPVWSPWFLRVCDSAIWAGGICLFEPATVRSEGKRMSVGFAIPPHRRCLPLADSFVVQFIPDFFPSLGEPQPIEIEPCSGSLYLFFFPCYDQESVGFARHGGQSESPGCCCCSSGGGGFFSCRAYIFLDGVLAKVRRRGRGETEMGLFRCETERRERSMDGK